MVKKISPAMAGLCTAGVRRIGLLALVPALAGVLLRFPRGTGPGDLTASASDGGHTVGPPAGDGIAEALRLLGSGCAAAVRHWTTPFVVCGEIATQIRVDELTVLVKLDPVRNHASA